MSQEIIEERVGKLETGFAGLRTEVAVLGRDVTDLKTQGAAVLSGINDLKTRDAARPPPTTWRNVAGTLAASAATLAGLAAFVWWFIAASPVIEGLREKDRELSQRLLRLDDPDLGRVPRLERDSWPARITRN